MKNRVFWKFVAVGALMGVFYVGHGLSTLVANRRSVISVASAAETSDSRRCCDDEARAAAIQMAWRVLENGQFIDNGQPTYSNRIEMSQALGKWASYMLNEAKKER